MIPSGEDGPFKAPTEEEARRLLHELQVHQIELEMQNEELWKWQEELDALLSDYVRLYDFAPTGYFSLGRDGMIRELNLTGAKLLGMERSKLVNRKFTSLLSTDSMRVFRTFLEKAWPSSERHSCELHLSGEGQGKVLMMEGFMVEEKNELHVAVWDITENKKTQSALRANELRFRELFNRMSNPVIIVECSGNSDLRIKESNLAFERLVGLDKNEISGKKIEDMLPGLECNDILGTFDKVQRSKMAIHVDASYYSDGKIAGWWESDIFPLSPNEIVYVISDITDLKKAELKLQDFQNKLNILGKITRHDILNQISIALGYLDMVKDNSSGRDREFIEKIEKSLSVILTQIRFAKNYEEIGAKEPIWQHVGKTFGRSLVRLDSSKMAVRSDVDDMEILADPLLEKCFFNLIDNSIQHGGGVTSIALGYKMDGPDLRIIYQDDGVGVSSDFRANLFQKGVGRHTGLGLFLTKMILNITDLDIVETGKVGAGARFEIIAPKGLYRFGPSSEN